MPAQERPRKDSGVSWLGSLPEGWQAVPLKQRTTLVSRGRSPDYSDDETGIPIVNQACIYWDGLRFDNVKWHRTERPGRARGRLFAGDLLVNSTGTGTLGRAAVFERSGEYFADSHVTVVRTNRQATANFLRYVLQTGIYQGYFHSVLAPGATNQIELSREGLRRTPFPMPPLHEQRAIAAFLDRKTVAIGALIAKKERLVELLQEKRQALITQAATKGLDPNVRMKKSQAQWLNEIPAHWEVSRLKYVAFIAGRIGFRGYTTADLVESGTGALALGATQILSAGKIDLGDPVYISWAKYYESPEIMVRAGDILVVQRGSTTGKSGFVADDIGPATINPSLILVRPRGASPRFLFRQLSGTHGRSSLDQHVSSTAIPMLSQEQLGNVIVVLPPLAEQDKIEKFLARHCVPIEKAALAVECSLSRLREYRQALITAAVTGQIDVSSEAA